MHVTAETAQKPLLSGVNYKISSMILDLWIMHSVNFIFWALEQAKQFNHQGFLKIVLVTFIGSSFYK